MPLPKEQAMSQFLLAIDQGTTSTRALVFEHQSGQPLKHISSAQVELTQHFPQEAWVEHDAEEIFAHTLQVINDSLKKANLHPQLVTALGITNQRETCLLWERKTGRALGNAIVWQDRRTAASWEKIIAAGHEPWLQQKTGLVADPYFSASKLYWLLEHVDGARDLAAQGELCAGTIDSWLIYRLTGGKVHATDATNASRTQLYNITTGGWDDELLAFFDIPKSCLPQVLDCAADYGLCDASLVGAAIPIRGVAGDQQAAAVGQACLKAGSLKATFGTGCFALFNTGSTLVPSKNRLLTTVALQLDGQRSYALEGAIFTAGAAVQWLRDGLGLIAQASDVESLAATVQDSGGVMLVPAFTGLGAPHWKPNARGAILGLTRDSNKGHIARATLDSILFQVQDLLVAMQGDAELAGAQIPHSLRVDGGVSANDQLMQHLADLTLLEVARPHLVETTALGAAQLAALGAGLVPSLDSFAAQWQAAGQFSPQKNSPLRTQWAGAWHDALRRII
jgi:glycerol kinase